MRVQVGNYEYELINTSGNQNENRWMYVIYRPIIQSSECFENEQLAKYAAIGHITLLEVEAVYKK